MTARLFAITDRNTASEEATLGRFAELGRLARPQSVVYQLRDLELGSRARLEFGRAIRGIARQMGQLFMVNDRIDLALLLGADGVHLGEAGVESMDARRLLGSSAFISRACHDPELVAALDADALVVSPVLESRKGRPALGLAGLERAQEVARRRGRPVAIVALGGIASGSAAACLAAGADAVAAIGGVLRPAENPLELVRALGIAR